MKQIQNMKTLYKLAAIAVACLLCVCCAHDRGVNPEFGPDEVYIYTNLPQTLSATIGEPTNFSMMVSPNDGSVMCQWLLNGVVISYDTTLEYTIWDAGVYKLRFEAEKGGFVNYREYKLTVSEQ